jgi:hypothetical protein
MEYTQEEPMSKTNEDKIKVLNKVYDLLYAFTVNDSEKEIVELKSMLIQSNKQKCDAQSQNYQLREANKRLMEEIGKLKAHLYDLEHNSKI